MVKETSRDRTVNRTSVVLAAGLALTLAASSLHAQEPSGLAAAAAIENALIETIAAAEKSVVAVARVRKEESVDVIRLEPRPDAFGRPPTIGNRLPPTDPNFVPNEYGAGVVVDRRGLVLTACHVLGDENDNYYITTSDRRVYRAWIKAADPRSDLAVLEHRRGRRGLGQHGPHPHGRRRHVAQGTNRRHPGQSLCDRPRRPGQRRLGHRLQPRPQGPAGSRRNRCQRQDDAAPLTAA